MTRFATLVSVFFFFIFSHSSSFAVNPNLTIDSQGELIVHFEGLSPKDASQIQSLVSGINGLTFNLYCAQLDVYLISFDNTIFASDEYALKAITNAGDQLRPVLMKDATYESVISYCH